MINVVITFTSVWVFAKGEIGTVNMFKTSRDFLTDRSKAVLLLWIILCHLCFMFVFFILSCLYLAALWSPVGKGLTSCLSCE